MPRNLDSNLAAHLNDEVILPALFCALQFSTGNVYAWSGVGPFTWGNITFQGVGNFGQVSEITESSDVVAEGITIQLQSLPLSAITSSTQAANAVVLQSAGETQGTWPAFTPYVSIDFNANVAEGSTLLTAIQGFNMTNLSAVSDSLGNQYTLMDAGSHNYGIAYTIGTDAGKSTASLYGTDWGLNVHSVGIVGVEVGNVVSLDSSSTFYGSPGYITGNITLPTGTYSFTSAYPSAYNWALTFMYFNATDDSGMLFAVVDVLDVQAEWGGQTVPGWTQASYQGGLAVYYQPISTGQVTDTNTGIDLAAVLDEIQLGGTAQLWLGALNQYGQLYGTPYQVFKGMVDQPSIDLDTKTITLSLALENRLTNLQRGNGRRYTAADQNLYYPDDIGFNWVEILNDVALKWGQ